MDIEADYVIDGLALVQTCGACPEQYDVFNGRGQNVGYLRLRHGRFSVDCPFGNEVYSAHPEGDGIFESNERDHYLRKAVKDIKKELKKES